MREEAAAFAVRAATVADLDVLVRFRRAMFAEMGDLDPALDRMAQASRSYFEKALPQGEFRAWIAEADGAPAGCCGAVVYRLPPTPANHTGTHGYIMNVYTEPGRRRKGAATACVKAALDALRADGVAVATLHASEAGRAVYERLGFELGGELRLWLGDRPHGASSDYE